MQTVDDLVTEYIITEYKRSIEARCRVETLRNYLDLEKKRLERLLAVIGEDTVDNLEYQAYWRLEYLDILGSRGILRSETERRENRLASALGRRSPKKKRNAITELLNRGGLLNLGGGRSEGVGSDFAQAAESPLGRQPTGALRATAGKPPFLVACALW